MLVSVVPLLSVLFSGYTLFICLCFLLWYVSTSNLDYWKKREIPFKKASPVFGNWAGYSLLLQPYHEVVDGIYNHLENYSYGGFFQMQRPVLLIRDPEMVQDILIKDFNFFHDRGLDYFFPHKELNPLSTHLVLMKGNRWSELRKKLNTAFTPSKLRVMQEQIFSCIDKLNRLIEEKMQNGSVVENLNPLYDRLTLDVIGSCAFGIDCNSLEENNEFVVMGHKAFHPNLLFFLTRFIHKSYRLKFSLADFPKKMTDFYKAVTLDTILYRRRNGVKRNDILQLLMEIQNANHDPKYAVVEAPNGVSINERFDEIDIVANSFLFLTTGYDTITSTITFCLYELALNQSIQDKLRSEVEEAYERHNYSLSADNLKNLKYLNAVISETVRKYPAAPFLMRVCTGDYQIPDSNHVIENGTTILIPVWSIHHDKTYYPDPEKFDPSRFLDTFEKNDEIRSKLFFSFGNGPRGCLGKQFAKMELRAAISDAVLQYVFTPCSQTQIPLSYEKGSLLLRPGTGIWLHITKRRIEEHAPKMEI